MFYVYGAKNSKATETAENLLIMCQMNYRLFILGEGYTVAQLQKLLPGTDSVPHIYDGVNYVGGTKELYDYLYTMVKFEDEENNEKRSTE